MVELSEFGSVHLPMPAMFEVKLNFELIFESRCNFLVSWLMKCWHSVDSRLLVCKRTCVALTPFILFFLTTLLFLTHCLIFFFFYHPQHSPQELAGSPPKCQHPPKPAFLENTVDLSWAELIVKDGMMWLWKSAHMCASLPLYTGMCI